MRQSFYCLIRNLKRTFFISLIGILFYTLPVLAESKVEYEGEANGLIAAPDDFFSDFGEMMPGDKKEETVFIRNKGNSLTEFFFYTKLEQELQTLIENENPNNTERQIGRSAELLKKVKLTIWMEKAENHLEIYQGNLAATTLQKGVSLGKFGSGEEGKLTFQIEIPKELGNIYASNDTNVIWVFSVTVDTDSSSEVNATTQEQVENKKESESSKNPFSPILEEKRESSSPVILGISDHSKLIGVIFIIGGSLAGIWIKIRKRK